MLTNNQRPYVILNVAASADGKIDTFERGGASISEPADLERLDRLRAEVDGILVGGRTLLENDPRLTIKDERLRNERAQRGLDPNPVKIGVITKADLKPNSRFLSYGPAQIMIFTTQQTSLSQLEWLEKISCKVFVLGETQVDLLAVMQQLRNFGIKKLLVEGGGTLNEHLLRLRLVDEIFMYIAPMLFGGANSPTIMDGLGLARNHALKLQLLEIHEMPGNGILVHYQPDYGTS